MKRWFVGVTILMLVISWLFLPHVFAEPSRMWVFSVGQGASVLYRDKGGQLLLFDGGPDSTVITELGNTLPPWQRRIDVVALSHTHADHLRGLLAIIGKYTVGEVWDSGTTPPGNHVKAWQSSIERYGIPRHHFKAGDRRQLGVTDILVLYPITSQVGKNPRNAHDANLALKLRNQTHSILLTGDLDEKHEKEMLRWCKPPDCFLQADILQIPHHGSANGLLIGFLQAVQPRFAFICVGQNNRYQHPTAPVLNKLEQAQVPYHRTDTGGGLEITFSKNRFAFRSSGSPPR
jgi:competence protein ComEC